MFLRGATNELHGDLKTKLQLDFTEGMENYPVSVDDAVAAIINTTAAKEHVAEG